MEWIASLFVQRPLNILVVAGVFLVGFIGLRASAWGGERHPAALLVPAIGWALYALWEWLVMVRTPEANIRVDLMVIWPVLLVLSVLFVVRALR
jgi:hypothetical protein